MGFPTRPSLLFDSLGRQVRDRADRLALRSEGEKLSLTFSLLERRIGVWAAALRAARVGPGELVALAVGNGAPFVELFFALRTLGASVLLMDAGQGPSGTLGICRTMRAAALLHRDGSMGGEALRGGPDPSVRLLKLDGAEPPPAGTALVKLTSGSTLDPRGACLTEEALLEGIDHIARGMEIGAADRVLISIPLSHSYGFDNGILSLAVIGTPLVLQPDILPAPLYSTLREHQITFFPAVPALVRALAQVSWPQGLALRRVISASAPLSREATEAFRRASGLRVHQFYGATESGGISFETRPEDPDAEGTVGFPLPGVRIELEEVEGVRVHSRANRFSILPGRGPAPAHVTTGDRAAWTPEGRLKLLGRIQPVGNIGGIKVDLGAIDAFFRGLPGVGDAAVLPVDDPVRGHRLVACVETRAHTPQALLELCRQRLSSREVPSEIRVLEQLPRTSRGKLDRAALSALLDGEQK